MTPELKALQGTWNIAQLEVNGSPMSAVGAQIIVKQGRFKGLGMGATYEGLLTIDQSQTPWALDMHFTAGPEKGNINRGIFELDKGRWRLCLHMGGGPRPHRFVTTPGSNLALETLERGEPSRKKKSAHALRTETPESSVQPGEGEVDPELEGDWEMTECWLNGTLLEPRMVKMGRRVVRGAVTTVKMGPQVILKARHSVNRSLQPHQVDYTLLEGPDTGKRQSGIFEVKGNSLHISLAAVDQPRPNDFEPGTGTARTIARWKRVNR